MFFFGVSTFFVSVCEWWPTVHICFKVVTGDCAVEGVSSVLLLYFGNRMSHMLVLTKLTCLFCERKVL